MTKNLVIRKSRHNENLILVCNSEKVYRVFLNGEEKINGLDYDEVSDYFNQLEKITYNGVE